ncbi:hypothetical protein AAIR98_001602 [Elusimicrobium simillimum]|uniref:hypothetical protein n=1 Tax=Elusimicrobium simillimum TaxID=3143438 RepID=UPI003C704BB1
MQNISQTFKQLINSNDICYTKKVCLQIRTVSAGGISYSASKNISAYIVEMSPIKWKLDTEGYGVWNTPVCTITLANTAGEFDEGGNFFNVPGCIYGSKVIIEAGIKKNGGIENIKLFQGYILTAPVYQPEEKTVTITVTGELATLDNVTTDCFSLSSEDEEAAHVEENTYATLTSAINKITCVKKGVILAAATILKEDYDYTVENLCEHKQGARIVLKEPLAEDEKLWVSFTHFHEDKYIHWIAHSIADAAQAQTRDIDEAEFGNSVINTVQENTTTGFKGELVGLQTQDSGLGVKTSFPERITASWEVMEAPATVSWTLGGYYAQIAGLVSSYCSARTPQKNYYGSWEFAMLQDVAGQTCYYHFISDSGVRTNSNGYAISMEVKYSRELWIYIYKVTNGALTKIGEVSNNYGYNMTQIHVRLTRDKNGVFRAYSIPTKPTHAGIWLNLGIICTDTSYNASNYQIAVFCPGTNSNGLLEIKNSNLYDTAFSAVYPEGYYLTPVIDGTESWGRWGSLDYYDYVPAQHTTQMYARTKTSEDAAWSDWASVSKGSLEFLPGRYIQFKWYVNVHVSYQSNLPYLKYWSFNWLTDTTKVAIVNAEGMSGLEVMKELAALTAYEIGYDRNGTFLFKKRNTDISSYFKLLPKDVFEVDNLNGGLDYIYNHVSASFGNYTLLTTPATMREQKPDCVDLYGIRRMSLPSGSLLPASGVDITKALSEAVYSYVSKKRKRAVFVTRLLPQLDLGDILLPQLPQINNIFMRIEGLEFDLENWQTRIDAVEVV